MWGLGHAEPWKPAVGETDWMYERQRSHQRFLGRPLTDRRWMSWLKPEAKHSGGGRGAMITREGQVANMAGRGEGLGPVRRLIWSQFPK